MSEVVIELYIGSGITEEKKKKLEETIENLLNRIDNFKIYDMKWRWGKNE